uniref:Uncharacterized protein n=1 Tax=mine drainage metagenome TaxID=410659 RepID=E6QJ74_9ZZZZ
MTANSLLPTITLSAIYSFLPPINKLLPTFRSATDGFEKEN